MVDDCKNRSISHSVPCSPVFGSVAKSSFLSQTSIPKIADKAWVQGVPTPIAMGSLSPNEQAVALLAGFASGRVTMEGESNISLMSQSRQFHRLLVKFGVCQNRNPDLL